jgi:hypothetical protein
MMTKLEAALVEYDALQARPAEEARNWRSVVAERDRREKQIEAIYEALSGEGKWMGRVPPVPPPDSGDLGDDAKALAERLVLRLADSQN